MRLKCRLKCTFLSAVFFSVAIPVVNASPLSSAGVFVFSSLCFGPEDPQGDKIVLIRDAGGITAVYWRTFEGPISAPLLAFGADVKIDEAKGTVSMRFVDPELHEEILLAGTASAEELDLKLVLNGHLDNYPHRVPRSLQEPRQLQDCKP